MTAGRYANTFQPLCDALRQYNHFTDGYICSELYHTYSKNKHLEALRLAMRAHLAEKYKNIFDEKEILSRQLISDRLIAQMTLEQGAVL